MLPFLQQVLEKLEHLAIAHPTFTGLVLVTLVFLAGYSDVKNGRPISMAWYWWVYGLLGVLGYFGLMLQWGHAFTVLILSVYALMLATLAWRRMRHASGKRANCS
jgi:hypothetical protein